MMTTTHILVAAAATTRPRFAWWQIALGWFGGVVPDLNIVAMMIWAQTSGVGRENLWRAPTGLYWQEPWQTYSAIVNSIPMWSAGLALGFLIFRFVARMKQAGLALMIFCGACLLHVVADLLVHTDDAHVHFWPFTDWRFHSPVSYYQRDSYGNIFATFEMVVGFVLVVLLVRHFKSLWVRIPAVALALPYFLSVGYLLFRG